MAPRLAAAATALLLAGCSGGGGGAEGGAEETAAGAAGRAPAWLDERYDDGRLSFSYPRWWEVRDSDKYGTLLADTRNRYPGFVSVRYFEAGDLPLGDGYAARVGRVLRPPDGRGLTLLYTQAARLGGRSGVEATFMWQIRGSTPLGPTFRTFGFELPSGRTAFLVFAAERPAAYGALFGWVRRTAAWDLAPGRAAGPVVVRKRTTGKFIAGM